MVLVAVLLGGLVYSLPKQDPYVRAFEKVIDSQKQQYIDELGGVVYSEQPLLYYHFLKDQGIDAKVVMNDTERGEFRFHVFNNDLNRLKPCEEYPPELRIECEVLFFDSNDPEFVTTPTYLEPTTYRHYYYFFFFASKVEDNRDMPTVCSDFMEFSTLNEPTDVCEWRTYAKIYAMCTSDNSLSGKVSEMEPQDLNDFACYYYTYKDYVKAMNYIFKTT